MENVCIQVTCLLKSKSELKSPVVVYCFDAVDEFDSLDDYIQRELNNDKYLVPITTEHLEYKGEYLSLIKLILR